MTTDPAKRTDRTARKATAEQVFLFNCLLRF